MSSEREKTRTRNVRIVVAALVLFASALLFGHHSESQLPFDAEVWKHAGEDDGRPHMISDLWKQRDGNVRLRMVSDLKPKLMGITKAEVAQLLGEPVTDVGLYPGDYYYVLGIQKKFGDTDGIWLCLKFKNDRVEAVQIVRD